MALRREWPKHSDAVPPSKASVYQIVKNFENTESAVDLPRSGRQNYISYGNEYCKSKDAIGKKSSKIFKIAYELEIPQTSVLRNLKAFGYSPWFPKPLHALNENDSDRRLQVLEKILQMCDRNDNFLTRLFEFSTQGLFPAGICVKRKLYGGKPRTTEDLKAFECID